MGSAFSKGLGLQTNDYELAVKSSKELEYILASEFEAHGKGLHEKITSAATNCPEMSPGLVRNMRYLATIRNKLIHERGVDSIPDKKKFLERFQSSQTELQNLVQLRRSKRQSSSGGGGVGENCIVM